MIDKHCQLYHYAQVILSIIFSKAHKKSKKKWKNQEKVSEISNMNERVD